jgi:hypothetical protein
MAQIVKIDKLLTNFATAYTNENFVADFVAPKFKVKMDSDKYADYTKSTLRVYDNKISGREKAKEIGWDVSTSTYTTEEYSLSYFIKDRDAKNTDKPVDLRRDALKQVQDAQILSREKRVYDIAGNSTIVTQTVAPGDWNTPSTGTPVADILLGMKTVNTSTLKTPNSMVVPLNVALSMITCDEWKEYFKYTGSNDIWNALSGLKNLGIDAKIVNVAGLSSYEGTGSDPAMEIMWGEKCLLFHREANPTTRSRTFMFSPFTESNKVTRTRNDRERGEHIDIYESIDELLVDANCGYLFTDTLA